MKFYAWMELGVRDHGWQWVTMGDIGVLYTARTLFYLVAGSKNS